MYNILVPASLETSSVSHKSQLFDALRNITADYFGKLYENRTFCPWLKLDGGGGEGFNFKFLYGV